VKNLYIELHTKKGRTDVLNILRSLTIAGLGTTAALVFMDTPAAAAKCQTIGSGGLAMTEAIARQMATDGLKNLLASSGMTPRGKVSMTCSSLGLFGTDCNARQKACK